MNVYLLPHHRLDPRFRYTLEREAPPLADGAAERARPSGGLWKRIWTRVRLWYRRLKLDYDNVVHGHEQIRLSRLVLLMDRDPSLTLVIPAGMTRECALEAIRGVIRSGLMAIRSHAVRNVITALVMMIVLFGATPTHVGAVIFYPLIGLYAWGRYWEDRLIRRTMTHLLDVGLGSNSRERFREEVHLAHLEEVFQQTPRPVVAYQQAVYYLDGLDQRLDGQASPEQALMYKYYSDIGRLDPYERYQDRIRKKLIETAKLVAHHLWGFWKWAFRWSLTTSRIVGLRVPNLLFVLLGALGVGYLAIAYFTWKSATGETFPALIRASISFSGNAKVVVEARPRTARILGDNPANSGTTPPATAMFDLTCPLDSSRIELWPVIAAMIAHHETNQEGKIQCPGEAGGGKHDASFEIRIRY